MFDVSVQLMLKQYVINGHVVTRLHGRTDRVFCFSFKTSKQLYLFVIVQEEKREDVTLLPKELWKLYYPLPPLGDATPYTFT